MERLVEFVDAAEREVLAHTVQSTRGLRAFFCEHGGEAMLGSLQIEAVRRGLYRYMGQRYAEVVKELLARTRQCIAFGRIRTDDQLKRYLVELAASLVPYSDLDLAINDLLNSWSLRLGLRYVRGLRAPVAAEIERVRSLRPFGSIEELARRVPSLSQAELSTLAETGALNALGEKVHRRDALWQVERAGRQAGPLLVELDRDEEESSPLQPMNPEERMVADYAGTGVTVGRHPMAHCRARLRKMKVYRAGDLKFARHGVKLRIAGQVIARQRPGTAHGFIFLSLEDETGIANAIVDPNLYEANRSLVTYAKFLLIGGTLQNIDKVSRATSSWLSTVGRRLERLGNGSASGR